MSVQFLCVTRWSNEGLKFIYGVRVTPPRESLCFMSRNRVSVEDREAWRIIKVAESKLQSHAINPANSLKLGEPMKSLGV